MRARFPSPSQPLYVRNLPQNSQALEYISADQYDQGIGYALEVTFDVNVIYTDHNNMQNQTEVDKQLYKAASYVSTGSKEGWNSTTYASSSQGGIVVTINPSVPTTGLPASQVIAHEVGYHNMANQEEAVNAKGEPVYDVRRMFSREKYRLIKTARTQNK